MKIDHQHEMEYKKIKELLKVSFSFSKINDKYIFRITEFRAKELNLPSILIAERQWEIYGVLQRLLYPD